MKEDNQIKKIIEVALLTNNQPLSIDDFQKMFDKNIERSTVRMLLDEIKQDWQDKSLELIQVAHGYRFQSKLEYSEFLKNLIQIECLSILGSIGSVGYHCLPPACDAR